MTEQQHPITPPDELVKEWKSDYYPCPGEMIGDFERYIATQASQWGYEQRGADIEAKLQKAPLSLKEQALEELREISIDPESGTTYSALETIRRAIESLPS